jgi:hypothetical protein
MDSQPTIVRQANASRGVSRAGRIQSDVERQAALPLCFFLSTRKVRFEKESVTPCAVMVHVIRHTSDRATENVSRRPTSSVIQCPERGPHRDNNSHAASLLTLYTGAGSQPCPYPGRYARGQVRHPNSFFPVNGSTRNARSTHASMFWLELSSRVDSRTPVRPLYPPAPRASAARRRSALRRSGSNCRTTVRRSAQRRS